MAPTSDPVRIADANAEPGHDEQTLASLPGKNQLSPVPAAAPDKVAELTTPNRPAMNWRNSVLSSGSVPTLTDASSRPSTRPQSAMFGRGYSEQSTLSARVGPRVHTPEVDVDNWVEGVDEKASPNVKRGPLSPGNESLKSPFADATPPAAEIGLPKRSPSRGSRSSSSSSAGPKVSVEEARVQAQAAPQDVITAPHDTPGLGITSAPTAITFPSTQAALKPRLTDPDGSLAKKASRKILAQMLTFQTLLVLTNGFFIFFTWYFTRYWYALIPIISIAVALNTVMVISLTIIRSWKRLKPTERIVPATPESLILLVPCYNETQEELTRSLDSLIEQDKIDDHQQAILIICDGRVRGPGMSKTCADTLLDDVLTDKDDRRHFIGGYTAWDQQPMDLVVQTGRYRNLPYICLIKGQNQGKRDSLILVRSFLYYYNLRRSNPTTIMTPALFNHMTCWLDQTARMANVDALIGMDADTILKDDCIYELIQESRFPKTLGVAGYVVVDWKDKPWSLWRLYQNCEYTVTQTLRRLHQGRATHKVSVLPGACQLLKITEETCGDEVLVDHFGKKPDLDAGLYRQIMASASEDGNHVCCLMTVRPHSQTRQALKSVAYTDVPHSWTVFLSQRRRWSLGASGNDWKLAFAPGILVFERILSFMNTVTWFITPFLFTAYATFIYVLVSEYPPPTTLV